MTGYVQKEGKRFEVLRINSYERRECRKRIVVSVKVAVAEHPVPKHARLHVKFKDGSEEVARAHLVTVYSHYAYYYLDAAYARKIAPLVNKIQEVKIYEEEVQ